MDFITDLPVTWSGFDAVFTVVDQFSKMVCFMPCCGTADAATVARLFFNNWVCKFGMPNKIISDRDTKFTSLFW